MAQLQDTLIVEFTGDSDVDFIAVADFDDTLNLDADGESTRVFSPGNDIHFWLHLSSNMKVDEVRATYGTVTAGSVSSRSKVQRGLFTSIDSNDPTVVTLDSVPSSFNNTYYGKLGFPTIRYGDFGVLTMTGGDIINIPYIVDVSYNFPVQLYTLKTPAMVLAEGESFPVAIVIYISEV